MGKTAPIGTEKINKNGYTMVKVKGGWETKQRVVAAKKLGRPVGRNERVYFDDGDNTNFDPDNIVVRPMTNGRPQKIEKLKRQISILQEELAELEEEEAKLAEPK